MTVNCTSWRKSASVLLVGPTAPIRTFLGPEIRQNTLIKNRTKRYSNSLTSPNVLASCSICCLMVQRSISARFMPSAVVFPGGLVEPVSDSANFWLNRQRRIEGIDDEKCWNDHLVRLQTRPVPRPPMFVENINRLMTLSIFNSMPFEWIVKVAAARELYEEVGLLPVVNLQSGQTSVFDLEQMAGDNQLKQFSNDGQAAVRANPDVFRKLFESTDRYALNLSAFIEWSNWLTPLIGDYNRRFDTIFYLLVVDRCLPCSLSLEEFQNSKWEMPTTILRQGYYGSTPVPPPQIYELSRLARFESTTDLQNYAQQRAADSGLVRVCPQLLMTSDGVRVMLLPGDEHYNIGTVSQPAEMVGKRKCQISADELRLMASALNRVEFRQLNGMENDKRSHSFWTRWRIYSENFDDPSNHLAPISAP